MKDLSSNEKRLIEATLREIHEKMFQVREETGLAVSVMVVSNHSEHTCIFLHDNDNHRMLSIDKVSDIQGCLDNGEWSLVSTNREEELHEEED